MFDKQQHPHRRYNPLLDEWVLVSPHRANRPWQGQKEKPSTEVRPSYDETCYLCPGNSRSTGNDNPNYQNVFVFDNDFPSLLQQEVEKKQEDSLFFKAEVEKGINRVICFSPDHSLTLPVMEVSAIEKVIETWQEQYTELGAKDFINHVQIFENKGSVMGCSNPHPHGQIWAQSSIPTQIAKTQKQLLSYYKERGSSLLGDYLKDELSQKERIVCENEDFVVLVPFWAVWPFETMIVSKRHFGRITDMTAQEKTSFAAILKEITTKYDNLFEVSFPYSSGIHQAPTDGEAHEEWHFHMHFYPPLLRSATVKKFMVGYEMLAEAQRDITAEKSAKTLQELSSTHYTIK